MEDFAREVRIAVLEDPEDEDQGFERDDPVLCSPDAAADGGGASGGVRFLRGDDSEDV